MGHRMGDRICMTGPPARGLLEKRGVRFAAHLVVLLLLPLLLLLFYAGLLRGPSPYEATAVSRLRAAGASLVVDLSQGSRDTWKDVSSLAPALHLAVSALPASLQALPPEEPSNGGAPSSSSTAISSGKVDAAPEGPPGGAYEMQGAPQRYPVAFCPTKGSISSFGCFSAAASLVEAPSLAAAADGGPSPLLRPSWGPPGLWLHGGDVSLLRRALKVLSGIDPRDMQTLLFQQQQQQQLLLQQQQQQQQKVSSTSMALLHVNSTSEGDGAPSLSPSLSPSQQRLLRRLKQLQQSKQLQGLRGIWGPRGPSAWEVGAETLQRAIIGGALLQCCEAAGLLLRLGQGAPAEEGPSPSGCVVCSLDVCLRGLLQASPFRVYRRTQTQTLECVCMCCCCGSHRQAPMQQHQEDEGRQQQQRENHWLRVFRERTARLNASNKHRILLGRERSATYGLT